MEKIKSRPWIVAHRGANREAPENTRSAFDAALNYNIDGMEFDVQMSSDGIPVLFHDRDMIKINRIPKRISDYSLEELEALDWGGWYSETFQGESILTLDKALKFYSQRTRLLIEIKTFETGRLSEESRELTLRILGLLKRSVRDKYLKNIFILSFNLKALCLAYRKARNLNYVLNLMEPFFPENKRYAYPGYLFAFCVPIKNLTKDFTEYAHQKGQRIMTYSCNTPEEVEKALNLRTDVIMTDKPGWLVAYFKCKGFRMKKRKLYLL